jgi:hypothetical protein
MAESDIVNSEVRGAVVVIQRGAVPLVDKARRAQMAGAAAALIVNTDERPLLAHGHRHRDGSHDLGQDIQIPVLVVSQSAGSMFGDGTAGVSVRLEYDVALQQSADTTSAYQRGSAAAAAAAADQHALQQQPFLPSQQYGSLLQPYVVPVQQHDVPMQAPGTPVQQYPAASHPHGAYGQHQALSPTTHRPQQQPAFSEGVPGSRLCSVVFDKPGPLGIYFVRGGTVVRPRVQVQRLGDNAPRMARESVLPGMQLFFIEHQDVTNYPYDAVIDMLQKASRPLTLGFGWAGERAPDLASPPAPKSPSVKEQVKAEIERALARSRQELEQTQAEALARIQLEADNRTAAAEAKAEETERQLQEHLLARQREESEHKLALQSEREKLIAEHEEAVAKMQTEADRRVAASEAGLTSAKSESDLERQRIEREHQSTVARLQSEADSRVSASETALTSLKTGFDVERQRIDQEHQSAVARMQSEADSRIAAMEDQMRESSERSHSEHKLALETSQAAMMQAHSGDLARIQSEAEARLKTAEARAGEAEREAQQHQDARHVVDGEMTEMKQQVEVRLQAAVEASRAELEEAHQAMLRVHTKAEAQVSESETAAAAKIEAAEHAAAETQRRLDETTLQLVDLQAALQSKDGNIAELKEQMRVAVIAEQTKAQEEVQQVEQRLEEQMTTAVEQSRAELDEAMAVVARVQQHAQDWIAEAENSTAAQIQDVHRRAQAEIAHVKQQSEREVALIRERALDGADSAREGDTRLETELEATRKELQDTKLALTRAQEEAAVMIAEKDHLVSLTETHRSESEMNSAGLVEAAQAEVRKLQAEARGHQAEVREVQAKAEAQVRSILEESRKDLEKANSEMMRIKDDAEKCITEAEQVAESKVSAAERIAESEAQERRESSAELDKMRSAVVEVTQNVDVRILEKERLATEAETRCKTALAKADEAAAAHARALAAEAQAKENAALARSQAREDVERAQALGRAENDTLQADLTRISAQMQELQEQVQIEKTRAQDELRLALAQKDEQIEALQAEMARSVADLEAEKRRACEQMDAVCTALNASRQRRFVLRVFLRWARQACVGAMINGITVGSEQGNMSFSQSQQSTQVVAARAAAEEYAKVFAVQVEEEAKRCREEQLAESAKQIRAELEDQLQSEVAQVVAKSHAELEEMQVTLARVQESVEHRIGTATRTQELAQKHQAISASKAAELERTTHAANADISMLKRQLEKTTQVAAEKLDEESSQREAAEARATAAEKQARRAADKARAAEAAIADERALRLAAEEDLAAVKKSRSALESREINRHKKEADMRKAFEEAAWRKAQDEKKAREAAERKLSQVRRPASSKRKAPRKAAEQSTQLSTPSNASRDHLATPDRLASSSRRTAGAGDSSTVGSRRTSTADQADAVVGCDSSDQTPRRDDERAGANGDASESLSRLLEEFRDCVRSDFTEVRRGPLDAPCPHTFHITGLSIYLFI